MAVFDFIAKLIGNDGSSPFELKNGRGLVNDDLEVLQAQYTLGVESQFLGRKPFLIRGGEITATGAPGLYDVAEALVFIKDTIALVPAQSAVALTADTYLHFDTDAGDPWEDLLSRSFAAGTSPSAGVRQYKFKISETLPSSGAYNMGVPINQSNWLRTIKDIRRSEVVPVGAIQPYDGSSANFDASGKGLGDLRGWALCDGQTITFDGSSVTLPNLKGRVPVHLDSSQTEFDVLNKQGGNKNLQQHSHLLAKNVNITSGNEVSPTNLNYLAFDYSASADNAYQFQGTDFEPDLLKSKDSGTGDSGNLQPYHTLLFVKYLGIE